MDKRTIVQDIKNTFDGASLVNVTEIAKYLGMSRNTVPKFLEGLDFLQLGTQRKYLASDVALRIMEVRKMG